ncbi:hypothetical protein [Rosenbergiella epipactidis]|uniref:hypothetical protein n=1 Tax=Rosenbergiella epipactidis TaxID=1544694 RepID=UPI001F4F35B3|nr:hypothetical protein [Rosenbergiella epipactidis]
MIALTQEKREELIACANEIKKMATSTHGYQVGNDAFGSNALMLMDVALASLTAVPFGWEIAGNIFPNLEEALKPGYIGAPEPIYDEPPLPEVKLPEMKGYVESHTQYSEGVVDGYNRCLAEIKRLNGLGE